MEQGDKELPAAEFLAGYFAKACIGHLSTGRPYSFISGKLCYSATTDGTHHLTHISEVLYCCGASYSNEPLARPVPVA